MLERFRPAFAPNWNEGISWADAKLDMAKQKREENFFHRRPIQIIK
jgi:hypothetical protein